MQDFEAYYEWRSQPACYTYVSPSAKTREESQASLQNIVDCYDKDNQSLIWGIALKENNKIIGSVNIGTISKLNSVCEIGWSLSPTYQRKGYAFEASAALLKYIFEQLNINKVTTFVWHKNEPSIKLAKKLGFIHEGTQREMRRKNGEVYDLVMFGLLKREWEQNNKK